MRLPTYSAQATRSRKKESHSIIFFSERLSIKNVQRLPFGLLPAVHSFVILPLPNNLFFREVILLMSRKGHSDNIKNPQNHSSPSVFKASCQMLCLSMVSASLLTAYKVLPSQHLEASSAWYIMESLQAETGIEEARGIVNSQYEQLPIQIVTNTSLSFLNIAESSAFRLGVWTTTNRRKG